MDRMMLDKYSQAEFFGLKNRLVKLSQVCSRLSSDCAAYYDEIDTKSMPRDDDYTKRVITQDMADVTLYSQQICYLLGVNSYDIGKHISNIEKYTDNLIRTLERDNVLVERRLIHNIAGNMLCTMDEEKQKVLDEFLDTLDNYIDFNNTDRKKKTYGF